MKQRHSWIRRAAALVLTALMAVTVLDLSPLASTRASAATTLTSSAPVWGESKKGVQGLNSYYYSDKEYGGYEASQVFYNLDLGQYYSSTYQAYWTKYTVSDQTFYINTYGLQDIANAFQSAKAADKVTYCTILLNAANASTLTGLAYTASTTTSDTQYLGMNTRTAAGRAVVQKVMSILASYYAPYVDYWILGNEVNQRRQYELGTKSATTYGNHYALAMTYVYKAMKSANPDVSVLVSLDHCWNTTSGNRFNEMTLINQIATYTSSHTDFNWGIAYHPYGEPVGNSKVWLTRSDVTSSKSTTLITMKNISVLTDYMQNSNLLYNGKVRPIAMTEIGLSANYGQGYQASAYAYTYYIAEANPYIVGILYNVAESGWAFGFEGRKAANVFRYMDTTVGHTYTDPYLTNISGATSWSSIIPNYSNVNITKQTLYAKLKLSSCDTTEVRSGSTVKLTATGTGTEGTLLYQFVIKTGSGYGQELILQDYSTKKTYTGKIRAYGKSKIVVRVAYQELNDYYNGNITYYQESSPIYITNTTAVDTTTAIETYSGEQYYIYNGKWYCTVSSDAKGLKNVGGTYYYLENGKVVDKTGLYQNTNGNYYYLENGVLIRKTGLVAAHKDAYTSDKFLYYYDADWELDYNWADKSVNSYRYYYIKNGVLQTSYTGYISDGDLTVYVKNGKQGTTCTGVKNIGNYVYYYFMAGVAQKSYTGFVKYNEKYYYAENGLCDLTYVGTKEVNGTTYALSGDKILKTTTGEKTLNGETYYLMSGYVYYNDPTADFYTDGYVGTCSDYLDGGIVCTWYSF